MALTEWHQQKAALVPVARSTHPSAPAQGHISNTTLGWTQRKRKEKTMPSGVIQAKLVDNQSFPLMALICLGLQIQTLQQYETK